MDKTIPTGHVMLESGLVVRRESLSASTPTRGRRRKSQLSSQDPLVDFVLTGRRDPRRRGTDNVYDAQRMNQQRVVEAVRERDPLTFRTVNYHDALTIGTGLTFSSRNPNIEAIVRRLVEANEIADMAHRAAVEGIVTGDCFGRARSLGPKELALIELYPSFQMKNIATKEGRPWYYSREWEEDAYPEPKTGEQTGVRSISAIPKQFYEDIPAEEIVHHAINRGAKDLRGMSPLLAGLKYSLLYGRSLEQVVMLQAARAFLGLHLKLAGAESNDPQVDELRDLVENQMIDRVDLSGLTFKSLGTGQAIVTGDNVDINVLNGGVNAGSSDAELRRLLLMFAVAPGMPEFALSDGNYANLASAETQSNPFFRLMLTYQAFIIGFIRALLRKSFDAMIKAGTIGPVALEPGMTHVVDWVEISGPDVLTPNLESLGPVLVQMVGAEAISRQELCRRLRLDWDTMKKEIEEEKKLGFKMNVPSNNFAVPGSAPDRTPGFGVPPPPSKTASGRRRLLSVIASLTDNVREDVVDKLTPYRDRLKAISRKYVDAIRSQNPNDIAIARESWLEECSVVVRELVVESQKDGNEQLKSILKEAA